MIAAAFLPLTRVFTMRTADTITVPLDSPNPQAWRTPLELALLGAIWGASFMFMRVASKDFGAAPLVELRLLLGTLVLLPFLWRA
jgi:hypothetical protein